MNRNHNKSSVVTTLVVLLVCLVLVTGSTFSLFTSDSKVNIAVTAGDVELTAIIDAGTLALYSKGEAQTGKFANGGTAAFNDTNTELTLTNITPGDSVEFNIVLENESTVDLQYRVNWIVSGELADALEATVNGADITSGTSEWTLWKADDTTKSKALALAIELPLEADDNWEELAANIAFNVEAVQANATSEYSPKAFVNTAAGLQAAIDSGATEITLNDNIVLEKGFVLSGDDAATFAIGNTGKSYVFDLNGNTLTATGNREYLFTVEGNANLTVKNGKLVAESTNHILNGTGTSTGASSSIYFNSTGNLIVEDVEIQGSVRGGHRAIDVYGGNTVLNNVTINTSYGAGIVIGGEGVTATLNNCDITVNGIYSAPYNSVCFGVWGGAKMTINSGNYKMINNNTYTTGDTHGGWVGIVMSSGGTITTLGGIYTNVPAAGFNPAYERAILEAENNAPAVSTLNILGGTFIPQEDKIYGGYGDQYYPTYNCNLVDNGNGTWTAFPEAGYEYVAKGVYKKDTVYHVYSVEGFKYFSAKALTDNNSVAESVSIVLEADIDMKGAEFSAIIAQRGDSLTFLGNGHKISNVKIVSGANDNTTGQASMFYCYPNSTLNVSDLVIENAVVVADNDASGYAAVVIGYCEGAVNLTNVDVIKATVTGAKSSGLIVGHLSGSLTAKDCDLDGTVTLTDYENGGHYAGKYIGTLAGAATLTDCTVNATINGNLNAKNLGDIYGRSTSAGSLALRQSYEANETLYYHDIISGEVVLSEVSEDFEGTTVEIPEGVTSIGGYAFASNSNIETIILPSTVTTIADRAFRDTSASTVVLNEGLTNISYQAFRNASNVKTVVIPSTVTTISKEAFQNSGITELVIPANVTTIEYGGLRDMKNLVTVTIEGNVEIPVYAFRACTELKTVYLKGNDVTFAGRGMIFTNKENGDGSAITVYVDNDEVKARLLAADTAAKDYGGYTIISEHPDTVYDAATMGDLYEFLPTLAEGSILVLPAGTYNTSGTFTIPHGITIKAAEGAEVIFHQSSSAQDNIFDCKGDVVIKNIIFESNRKGYAVNGAAKNHDTDGDITLIGCTFRGIASEKNWGVYKNLNGNLVVKNCTFDNYNNAICGVNNGNGSTTVITGCTFTNINGEAIGYVSSTVEADFESNVIANNTGLTADNVIGY